MYIVQWERPDRINLETEGTISLYGQLCPVAGGKLRQFLKKY